MHMIIFTDTVLISIFKSFKCTSYFVTFIDELRNIIICHYVLWLLDRSLQDVRLTFKCTAYVFYFYWTASQSYDELRNIIICHYVIWLLYHSLMIFFKMYKNVWPWNVTYRFKIPPPLKWWEYWKKEVTKMRGTLPAFCWLIPSFA